MLKESHWGVRRFGHGTFVSQQLDVVGLKVGAIGLLFDGDHTAPTAGRLARMLDTIAEELDTVLMSVQTASEKHQLLVTINHLLSNRVFEAGMDQAVRALCEKVKLPGFMLLYRDAVESAALHYRMYKYGQLEHASNGTAPRRLDGAMRAHGPSAHLAGRQHAAQRAGQRARGRGGAHLRRGRQRQHARQDPGVERRRRLLGASRWTCSACSPRRCRSGWSTTTASAFTSRSSSRAAVIDELLQDPDYERRYLAPRAEEVGILFADINGFTRICEQVLERPERIGKFVDDWSEEAVRILHRHGGVFDKMVGDCVIGLFGPPFFRDSAAQRAPPTPCAPRVEIQAFTREKMSAHPEVSRLQEMLEVPGLGVAIGVNLAPTFCGLFGPNRQYTGFSTGMNQTARLQSLGALPRDAGDGVGEARRREAPDAADLKRLQYGPLTETPVKNVEKPLRHFKLL